MDNVNQTSSQKPKDEPAIKQAGRFRRVVKVTAAATTAVVSGLIYIITRGHTSGSKDS